MIIDNGVEMIQLEVKAFGSKATLYPTLIWDENEIVLIDVGMPGAWKTIKEVMVNHYLSPENLKAIILTHQDLDHIGSIEEIKRDLGNKCKVYAHQLDQPYIEGKLPLLKSNLTIMEPMLKSLPEIEKREALQLLTNLPKTVVDEIVTDGQVIPYCGGIRVIHTPGHTEGHISLYLEKNKILIAADAMMCVDGKLMGPVGQTTLDLQEARRSLKKFLNYDIESVICYHGGLCELNAKKQVEQLVRKLEGSAI